MKAISLFYSIDTDTMYHHAPRPSAPGDSPEGARYHGRTADALASEVDEGRGKAAIGPGRRKRPWILDSRMGEPSRRHGRLPRGRPSHAGTTGGTETSKYPEEEKSTEIARVAASESARAQTCDGAKAGAVASQVLRDEMPRAPRPGRESENRIRAERHGKAGRSG